MMPTFSLKNGLQLTLRRAAPHDAEQLLAYLEHIAGESENITYGPGELGMRLEDERTVLAKSLTSATDLYILATIAGEIAGTLTFAAGKRPRVQHAGEFGTTVARRYWNLGIGGHMLDYLITWAQATGTIRKINLRVRVDNLPAIHVYAQHGFVHEGRLSREFYLHGAFVDAFVMGLPLDPVADEPRAILSSHA